MKEKKNAWTWIKCTVRLYTLIIQSNNFSASHLNSADCWVNFWQSKLIDSIRPPSSKQVQNRLFLIDCGIIRRIFHINLLLPDKNWPFDYFKYQAKCIYVAVYRTWYMCVCVGDSHRNHLPQAERKICTVHNGFGTSTPYTWFDFNECTKYTCFNCGADKNQQYEWNFSLSLSLFRLFLLHHSH